MWRALGALILASACTDPIAYDVTTAVQSGDTARLVFDGLLYTQHTEHFEVYDYAELRDAAVSVTVRSNNVDNFVVLPFAASACGSEEWVHTGELTHIGVQYRIYGSGTSYTAYTEEVSCTDDAGDVHTVQ